MAISVTDVYSNPEPHIRRALDVLGKSEQKWKVFCEIYRGKKKTKSVEEVANATGLQRKQVLDAGKQLERARLVRQEPSLPVLYSKLDDIALIRDKIIARRGVSSSVLRLAKSMKTKASANTLPGAKVSRTQTAPKKQFDVFISHASEDKEPFVRGLAEALRCANISVWYDEYSLDWGDSLRTAIEKGLASSRYAIVVLSQNFFKKPWPQSELDGLFALEMTGQSKILPIWHDLDHAEVAKFQPLLATKLAVKSTASVDEIVVKLQKLLKK